MSLPDRMRAIAANQAVLEKIGRGKIPYAGREATQAKIAPSPPVATVIAEILGPLPARRARLIAEQVLRDAKLRARSAPLQEKELAK